MKIFYFLSIMLFFSCSFIAENKIDNYVEHELALIKIFDSEKYDMLQSINSFDDVFDVVCGDPVYIHDGLLTYRSDDSYENEFEPMAKVILQGYSDCEEMAYICGLLLYYYCGIESRFVTGYNGIAYHAFLKIHYQGKWFYFDPDYRYDPTLCGYVVLFSLPIDYYI